MKRFSFQPTRTHRDIEHQIQVACVNWFNLQYPMLRGCLIAVPNGGRRDAVTGARLKAEGATAGVSDLILFHRCKESGALLIEMKTPTGRQSTEQKQWQKVVESQGYKYVVCRSLDEFMRVINTYIRESINK
ncbi:MAG: VRR-NUC domain-containing protein [Muribaculaceae bacterium]|nr:VRR-NUC domain-containing protein [Muribaculaceae bacterium]